ncbi:MULTISPECIES: replication protein [unclassified Paenibacillus]|uniref:replication protein n=1 Tax=unclassified Paenibacillus TaxID=185978 RepID=UPI0030F8E273
MADVQKENGFTPVAHELIEAAAKFKFNATQFRIILIVWRYTYGFHRKDHDFSLSFLQENTGLPESSIKRETSNLIRYNVLVVTQKETSVKPRRLSFNKNYDEWEIQKSGDSMDEQLDLFSIPGVSDLNPPNDGDRGIRFEPPGVSDLNPQEPVLGYQKRPPDKDISSLNISFKDKEALFDEFYKIYPRKVSRKKARESWKRLCKHNSFNPDEAIAFTNNFVETCKLLETETKFIPYPATYLNQERWKDYPTVDPEGLASSNNDTLSENLDFLKKQMGGAGVDGERGQLNSGEGYCGLPEQRPES